MRGPGRPRGSRDSSPRKSRGVGSVDNVVWIIFMSSVLGSAEVLTSAGWIGRVTGNFIVAMIFLAIIYLGARLSGTRIAGLSAAILTIATATVFFLADKYTYTQYFQGVLGSLLPYPNIQPLSFFPGLPIIETSPGWYAALTLLLFVVGTVCYFVWESKLSGHYRPFSAAFLGVAVTMLSFFALLFGVASMLVANVTVSGELMIPFIPFVSWWWPLAIVYLALGIGLWVAFKGAWWLYLILQIAGLALSLWHWDFISLGFGVLIIVLLLAGRKGFKTSSSQAISQVKGVV